MQNFNKDYYAILRLSSSATAEEIKAAYWRLAKKNHPDIGGSELAMQVINEAYSVLIDPTARREYDMWYAQHCRKSSSEQSAQNNAQQSTPPPPRMVTVHILDPKRTDTDYYKTVFNYSDLEGKIASAYKLGNCMHNGELYAYMDYSDSFRGSMQILHYEEFAEMLSMYRAFNIQCYVLYPNGNYKSVVIFTNQFLNGYKLFIRPDTDLMFAFRAKTGYIAVSQKEFKEKANKIKSRLHKMKIAIKCCSALLVAALIIYGFICEEYSPLEPYSPNNDTITAEASAPPLQTPPAHNSCLEYSLHESNFTIKTTSSETSKYYFLKAVRVSDGETVQSVFIHAGETANIYVPPGTYTIKWTSGNKWYGYHYYFNNKYAQQSEDPFTFDNETGWEITLYPVSNGNMETESIDINNF